MPAILLNLALLVSLFAVLEIVRRGSITDKYGSFFIVFLAAVFVFTHYGLKIFRPNAMEALAVLGIYGLGLWTAMTMAARLSVYSNQRRTVIQELALARVELEQLKERAGQTNLHDTIAADR